MSQIILNSENISRFNKRLQKALSEHFAKDIKLSEASKIFAKAIGKNSEHELKEVLNSESQKKTNDKFDYMVEVYLCIEEAWVASKNFEKDFILNSREVPICGLYSKSGYEKLIEKKYNVRNTIVVAVKIKVEDMVECTNASLFGDTNNFYIQFLVDNNKLKCFHDEIAIKKLTL